MDDLATALARVLAGPLGGEVSVEGLVRLPGGASRETWAFDAVAAGERHELILQRVLGGELGSMDREALVLRAMGERKVPVPPLLTASSGEPDPELGTFTITRRLAGETIARRILRDDAYADARPRLAAQLGRAAALLHQVPDDEQLGLVEVDPVASVRDLMTADLVVSPAFELTLRWLESRRPPTSGRTIVHGDLRMGNLIVDGDGLVALIDWEGVHVGDPLEDLGWLCVRAWRFGGRGDVAGVGSVEELVRGYEEAGGSTVDLDVLRWWEVYGNLRWGLICAVQADRHLSGTTRSVELATIGRRVCEQEDELLHLLGVAAAGDSTPIGEIRPGLHGRPTAVELVDAAAEFLEGEVMAGTDGRLRFQARVGANALRIVQRQLQLGGLDEAAHSERLAALGFADDAELVAAIRRGACDDRWDEVATAVAAGVRSKLEVANPKWLEGER